MDDDLLKIENLKIETFTRDAEVARPAPMTFSGAAAVLAVVSKHASEDASILNPTVIHIANIGDCRAVLCRGPEAIDLTIDHKASNPVEKARVEKSGGFVHNGRLDGILAISRAFGDLAHKRDGHLIATPDVVSEVIELDDEFLLLASDGLFDVLTSQQAVNFIRKKLRKHGDVQLAAQELVLKAQEYVCHDNVSVIVICFNQIEQE